MRLSQTKKGWASSPGDKFMKWIIKSAIRKYAPKQFVEYIRKKRRIKKLEDIRLNTEEFNLSTLEEVLDSLNINRRGNLFIHSGSDYFSNVQGGPFAVLQTLTTYMENGTLIMPAFPFDGMASEYLDDNIFSMAKSPSKMGLITELFRRSPAVKRSLHPTHSVCASGENAKFLTEEHHNSIFPFGDLSPFTRLISLKGQVLMIGIGLEVLTIVHAIEDELKEEFPINVYQKDARVVDIIDNEGNNSTLKTLTHDANISVRKNITQFEASLLEKGILTKQSIAGVDFRLLDAYQLHMFLKNEALKNKTIYN